LNIAAKAVLLDEIYEIANDIDIVITSVSAPHYMITAGMLQKIMDARPNHPIVLIDIAVPRNIEPSAGEIEGVHLYNIDSLKEIADDNLQNRLSEARLAEEYINENVDEFFEWKNELSVTPVITSIQNRFEEIRCMELERYRKKKLKHLSPEDFAVVEELTKQIMTKTLHNPIMNLKKQRVSADSDNIDIESLKRKTRFIEEIFTER